MSQYYLAIDIGASSGRHILGEVSDGKLQMEEIHRFENGLHKIDGHLCWDIDTLYQEILEGLRKCKALGKIPSTVSIDTWAVDFVLLDKNDQRIGNAVGYRDSRTLGMDQKVYEIISEDKLYERTGIQKQIFNTIYQLMAVKQDPVIFHQVETLLMIPDYLQFLLTGKKVTEYTNATTTQLVNPETKNWDYELMEALGFPSHIFTEIKTPSTSLGYFTKEVEKEVGFSAEVILPATHDTGSAVMAIPTNEEALYISSGTWSLMGVELKEAITSLPSKRLNFTNEGGYDYRYRYLKNIMGLWMIQSVKKEIGEGKSFGDICEGASNSKIASLVDANDSRFLSPNSMTEEVQKACRETNQEVPNNLYDVAAVIYNSLASCYGKTIQEIESITGKKYDYIHIIGGGANADYLNYLTAKYTNQTVYAGPIEATAIGNLMAQMISKGEFQNLQEARECVRRSFEIKVYK